MLLKIEKENSYSNLAIAGVLKGASLSDADKAFFTALVYGTVERKITLDYNLSVYLKQPLKKLKPQVLAILRLGAYQILFMDKVPNRAAINESVNLAKSNGASFASGLVNAVLRKLSENGIKLPEETEKDYMSVKYSCPQWLIDLWTESYGLENTVGILEHSLGTPKTYIRINTLKQDMENPCVEYTYEGAVESSEDYKKGLFHVQDKSSQLCCAALDPRPGETVFDLCAAPGGKSFTIAEYMENKGELYSFDLYEHRVKLIQQGALRLGLDIISAEVGDASVFNDKLPKADKILCDVPCSGLGVIGRKPEIRYKTATNIDCLPTLQYNILTNASRYLKKNGTLVYSTCTLNPAENESVVNRFILKHPDFHLESMTTVLPHLQECDGFFFAVLKFADSVDLRKETCEN